MCFADSSPTATQRKCLLFPEPMERDEGRKKKENFSEKAKLLQWRMEFFHTLGSLYFLASFFYFFKRNWLDRKDVSFIKGKATAVL